MIKQETIEAIRSKMDIHEVVEHFIRIKKDMACCPFHNEKTPSMHVWRSSQQFKCFGCGESGDSVGFVMKHERKTYPEAIEWLADFYNVTIEYDEQSKAEAAEIKDRRKEQTEVMQFAWKQYQQCLASQPDSDDQRTVKGFLRGRGIEPDVCSRWGIGYSPNEWKYLTTPLINMGRYEPGHDLSLIHTKDGNSFDFFRNRLMVPIQDLNGNVIGFGGRMLPTDDADADKKQPKYINSKDSMIYNKGKVLFGLYKAITAKAIKEAGFAYWTEGYFDVISLHEAGVRNAVAPCGTEVNEEQIKLLKRYTDHVVMAQDGDAAGIKAAKKQIDRFLVHDFKVELLQLPKGMDADEFVRTVKPHVKTL